MDRYIGLDVHSSSCTLAVAGRRWCVARCRGRIPNACSIRLGTRLPPPT